MCKQPNILLIVSDQQRTDTLGFMGRTPCQTPHLDRLARSGICFDRCLTPNPLCTPARAALFTGQYPHQVPGDHAETGERTNMMTNNNIMRAEPVLTDRLRKRGYHCFNAGKWHLGDEVLGAWFDEYAGHSTKEYSAWCLQQGLPDGWTFNDMRVRSKHAPHHSIPRPLVQDLDPSQGNDAWITDHAIRFIESRPADKPFFGVCSLNGPHPPFVIPEPYFSMIDEAAIPEPANFGPGEMEPAANRSSYYRKVF